MERINEKFPRNSYAPTCTRCGGAMPKGLREACDLCDACRHDLSVIWPDDPAFAAELEREDADERLRLKLGMGE